MNLTEFNTNIFIKNDKIKSILNYIDLIDINQLDLETKTEIYNVIDKLSAYIDNTKPLVANNNLINQDNLPTETYELVGTITNYIDETSYVVLINDQDQINKITIVPIEQRCKTFQGIFKFDSIVNLPIGSKVLVKTTWSKHTCLYKQNSIIHLV
jgi:hypothetical protein